MITASNQMLAEFGHGDILVGSMLCSDGEGVGVGVLTLTNADEPKEIGTYVDHPKDANPFDAPIVLAFTNIQSLDVVINHLNKIRSDMEAFENGDFDWEDSNAVD